MSAIRDHRKPYESRMVRLGASVPHTKCESRLYSQVLYDKWVFRDVVFKSVRAVVKPKEEKIAGPIARGIQNFESNPVKFLGIKYQTNMLQWPQNEQQYSLLHRQGAEGFEAVPAPDGTFTIRLATYQALDPKVDVTFVGDRYTEKMAYQGRLLHSAQNRPICPGRGQGVCDAPNIKIIGAADPGDISQGSVGDCWLLSAIAGLAEFRGTVRKLFAKTGGIDKMPRDGPNQYVVTLYDLKTWRPVDVVVDERLAAKDGQLLGAKPSCDGELWACYLEKAFAVHCGGWDDLDGGLCTHAWSMLTGCKEVYTINRLQNARWSCSGKFNPNTNQWEPQTNSTNTTHQGTWPMKWPRVGGGGDLNLQIDNEDLFERMCAWDDLDFIISCAAEGSEKLSADGIVDGHAYSVLRVENDVAGTDNDLIQVRNPWGRGEMDNGRWDDDGPGWNEFPQVKAALKLVARDDGVFWMSKQEFFQRFSKIYLCAMSMSEFIKS
eukprot:Selendium_serpulae@DN6185_c0_g1_i2.p1